MANRKVRYLIIAGIIAGSCLIAWAIGVRHGSQAPGEAGVDLASIRLVREDVTAIKGRLLDNEDLRITETDFHDLSMYTDLILALTQPWVKAQIKKATCPHIAELLIERREGAPLKLVVVWPGGAGNLVVANHGPYCYRRAAANYPVAKDKYVDEPAALGGLIEAVIKGDKEERSEFERMLRESLGLVKPARRDKGPKKTEKGDASGQKGGIPISCGDRAGAGWKNKGIASMFRGVES